MPNLGWIILHSCSTVPTILPGGELTWRNRWCRRFRGFREVYEVFFRIFRKEYNFRKVSSKVKPSHGTKQNHPVALGTKKTSLIVFPIFLKPTYGFPTPVFQQPFTKRWRAGILLVTA